MKELVQKKRLGTSQRTEAVRALQGRGISLTHACRLIGVNRTSFYFERSPKDDGALKARMHELAQQRPRWGWRRLFIVRRGKQATVVTIAGTDAGRGSRWPDGKHDTSRF